MASFPVRSAVARIAAGVTGAAAVDVVEAAGEAAADEIVGGVEAVAVAGVEAIVEGVEAVEIDVGAEAEVEVAMTKAVAEVSMVVSVKKHRKWSLQRTSEGMPLLQVATVQVQRPSRLHLQCSHLKQDLWGHKHHNLRDRQRRNLRGFHGCRINRNRHPLSKRLHS